MQENNLILDSLCSYNFCFSFVLSLWNLQTLWKLGSEGIMCLLKKTSLKVWENKELKDQISGAPADSILDLQNQDGKEPSALDLQ